MMRIRTEAYVFVSGIQHPILIGRASCHFLEPSAEMLRVGKSQFVGYFADGLRGVEHPFFRHLEHLLLDVFQGGHSGLLLDEVAEIVGGKAKRFGALLYRRHPLCCGLARCEIVVQQILEAGQDVVVGIFAGDELTVVETDAVVEQQFDVVGNQ